MYVYGQERSVSVYWDGRATSRAAAALLITALRYGLRYQNLRLVRAPTTICHFAIITGMQDDCKEFDQSNSIFDNLMLLPAIGWAERPCFALEVCHQREVVPLRLQVAGGSAAPLRLHMHVFLKATARTLHQCRNSSHWSFYRDHKALIECGFTPNKSESDAILWYAKNSPEGNKTMKVFVNRQTATSLHIKFKPLNSEMDLHILILNAIQNQNKSVLFIDYDIWKDLPGVQLVEPPPCSEQNCKNELDPTRSLRVADVIVLKQLAPHLLRVFEYFSPTSRQLREVLQLETKQSTADIEEAACEWALNNTSTFDSWYRIKFSRQFWIVIFLCKNDEDKDDYKKIVRVVEQFYRPSTKFNVSAYFIEVDCSSESDLTNKLIKASVTKRWANVIGALAAGSGTKMAAEYAMQTETALVLYDLPNEGVRLGPTVYAVGGTLKQLAIATRHFISSHKWRRLAILSEETQIAKDFVKALQRDKNLIIRNTYLHNETDFIEYLQSLKNSRARILLLNSISNISKDILCLAQQLGMTFSNGYVWILREWHQKSYKCVNLLNLEEFPLFTISYWWQGHNDGNENNILHNMLKVINRNTFLPPLAVPMADALQLVIKSFDSFTRNYAPRLNDMHGNGTVRLLLNNLEKQHFDGLLQNLHYVKGSLANPLVFIKKWIGNRSTLETNWTVINESIKIDIPQQIFIDDNLSDGSHNCFTKTVRDPFDPYCQDSLWFTITSFLVLIIILFCISWKIRMRNFAHHDAILTAQLLAQRKVYSTTLNDHLVDRGALDLYHDLGRGCYGRVRYGVLRAPNGISVSVAVKELVGDDAPAEESELLREAVTLASLRHPNIVRLIGVCTTDGPLLVLMEYALFGNLREYLNKRRHLVDNTLECTDIDDEAFYISAESITKLAREAVSALEYLSSERLVHRDIRAANCLIDEQRSLKLADFGLARTTGTGDSGGDGEYLCRRRGLFPVLWMAPESLELGVFTTASDIWALGVLLLEMITLGARPYGDWLPSRVMNYVCDGGHPPLPINILPETEQLLLRCWRQNPEERITVTEVGRELAEHPSIMGRILGPIDLILNKESLIQDGDVVFMRYQ
ncbi:unnamed protein product [Diatraea saccharalis]|uniref:Protein kinase domain-containing protein n=1 Tax=Diatraea saccharalis TaxID=40085 RepID=A0A9N9W8L9_9NEOP|nr:unnamed protein product [Diatraea saccharalis]